GGRRAGARARGRRAQGAGELSRRRNADPPRCRRRQGERVTQGGVCEVRAARGWPGARALALARDERERLDDRAAVERADLVRDLTELLRARRFRCGRHQRLACIAALAQQGVERNAAEQRNSKLGGEAVPTTGPE